MPNPEPTAPIAPIAPSVPSVPSDQSVAIVPIVALSVRVGSYHDSVVLMRLQRSLAARPGVLDAGVVMATSANREILAASGLLGEGSEAAGPGDLLIAVRAETSEAAAAALADVDALLAVRAAGGAGEYRPRSLDGALRLLPEARWVLVSVPGRFAAAVAREALDAGRNVFLYSDNVALEDELALKRTARERGLLVLGPDCGTAIVGGAGLGFANRVRRGAVGLVAASGTGLQAVASRLDALGSGVSQAIGLGGRDLASGVGGLTALAAFDLLVRDPETRAIVLLGKPPAPEVAARLLARAGRTAKPIVACFLGLAVPLRRLGPLHFASSFAEAAELAAALAEAPSQAGSGEAASAATMQSGGGFVRGLFSGGTLAYEVQLGLQLFAAPIWSNAPVGTVRSLPAGAASREHTILDLGADEFTVGRLHPMLDPDLRLRRLWQEADDPAVSLLVLDVVLGDGAHADPAGVLAPALEGALARSREAGRDLEIVALLIGTDDDPQDAKEQAATLARAGATVVRTTEELIELAWARLAGRETGGDAPPVPLDAVRAPLAAINVGVETFAASLVEQGVRALQVDWRPPAGGNERLAGILERMKAGRGARVR